MLASFAAFDVETTGVDPERDHVIQLGAVRVDDGRVTARWSRLVDPGVPVPLAIQRLTGITPARLAGQPSLAEVLPEFLDFAGARPLVAHNAPFDVGFIGAGLRRLGRTLSGPVYDTLELARLVLPATVSHRLQALVEVLDLADLAETGFHDALADAEAAALLFCGLVERLRSLDRESLTMAARFLHPTLYHSAGARPDGDPGYLDPAEVKAVARGSDPALAGLLARVLAEPAARAPAAAAAESPAAQAPAAGRGGDPDDARRPVSQRGTVEMDCDPAVLAGWLAPGGLLAKDFTGYERREGQLAMLREVACALRDGRLLVVEAGTGTGKSMAYLVPALAWAVSRGERVVVSTHTITLQEQICRKELPFLRERLPFPFRAVLAKGRGHYFCRLKWEEVARDPAAHPPAARRVYGRLAVWLAGTRTGDRAEINLRREEEAAWAAVAADAGCAGERCRHRDRCFFLAARRQAEGADLLVANHALLLADLATGGNVLPRYEYLVCDEAHHLPEAASEHLGLTVDERNLHHLLASIDGPGGRGLAARLERKALPVAAAAEGFSQRLAGLRMRLQAAREGVAALFSALRAWAVASPVPHGDYPVRSWRLPAGGAMPAGESVRGLAAGGGALDGAWSAAVVAGENLVQRLEALAADLSELGRQVAGDAGALLGGGEELPVEIDALAGAASQAAAEVAAILAPGQSGENSQDAAAPARVAWFEWDAGGDGSADYAGSRRAAAEGGATDFGRLRAAPLFPGPLLAERLWGRLAAGVLTSATLTVGGGFDHFTAAAGLDGPGGERVDCHRVASPFDYGRQALLCIPRGLPEPRGAGDEAFAAAGGDIILRLARIAGGRTLVLFTANRMLRRFHARLRPALEDEGILALAQGVDGSRSRLMEEFLANPRTVLFGAASFWEGIDLPGDALRCVVLVRLPFRPPGTPLMEARLEALARQGEDGFRRLSLPEAVIRFRQGFGRLIRRAGDRGAVVVLDSRLLGRYETYGRVFLDSLPEPCLCVGSEEEVLREFSAWLEGDLIAAVADQ